MTVAITGRARPGPVPARGSRGSRAGLAGTLRSELTKIRSVRALGLQRRGGYRWTAPGRQAARPPGADQAK